MRISHQIKTDPVIDYRKCYRHISKGAWPFSTRDQSYTLSDCTGEALKAILLLQNDVSYSNSLPKIIPKERLFDAVNILLSMQNKDDGGYASYELRRGPFWLEWLNPAVSFGFVCCGCSIRYVLFCCLFLFCCCHLMIMI